MSSSGPMTFETVDIRLTDTVTGQPIVGAVVKVLSQDGKLTYTTIQTDTAGTASCLLPAPATYQVRFYKFSTTFYGPLLIAVQSAPATNQFTAQGTAFQYPQATDPRLCLASGFFRTPSGAPAKHVDLQFIATFDPVLLEGNPILTERVTVHTDRDGYVEVNLIRFGIYELTVQGMEDMYRKVYVPDSPYVNMGDLILPVVTEIDFNEGPGPFAVSVGGRTVVTPIVRTSDLRVLPCIDSDVHWSSDNPNVMQILVAPTTITLVGISAGTANLVGKRHHHAPIRIPNTPIVGVPVSVTVS